MDDFPNLSPTQRHILDMIITNGEMYGLEMVAASNRLKRGTVYVTLNRMEEKGLIESRTQELAAGDAGAPRRIYKATGHGARVLQAYELASQSLAGETA
jgi:DNA-binding PadR family transcriptional regulator